MLKQGQGPLRLAVAAREAEPRGTARVRKAASVKPREERQKVMIKARMRSGASWHDVCVLNVSRHGVGIQAAEAPARGAYVEIRRGPYVIVARVAWSRGHRAGLRSQDPISIRAIVNDLVATPAQTSKGTGYPVERRRSPRTEQQRHDRSRFVARAMEFACFAIVAGAMALTAFGSVEKALARPLSQISAAQR
jgi:hypothetical protein